MLDLGPNLGALNRTLLGGCDYFITPLSPDLFSIKGTQNLGNKFVTWHDEWENNLRKWKQQQSVISKIYRMGFLNSWVMLHNSTILEIQNLE